MNDVRRIIPHTARNLGAGLVLSIGLLGGAAAPVQAQNAFAPVLYVNDTPITAYELDQRKRFVQFLGGAGDLEDMALSALTEDRLYADAAERRGLTLTPEEIEAGMAEFAARGDLETEAFVELLNGIGVSAQTFRDFVSAGLLWRKVVRQEFGGANTVVTERDIDLALSPTSERAGLRVLFSEIYLPARNAGEQAKSQALAEQLKRNITSLGGFASAARQYSVAPTRGAGGRVNWTNLADLPPPLAQGLRPLAPGQIAGPISAGNVVALFQLRAVEEADKPTPARVTVDYATYAAPADLDATALRGTVDTCDDLYGLAKDQPPEVLTRISQTMAQVPGDIALELGKLDENEISTALTRAGGTQRLVVMLCERRHESQAELDAAAAAVPPVPQDPQATAEEGDDAQGPPPDPEALRISATRSQIINSRIQAQADILLAELKAEAILRTP
ncbi:peptidylprolyl isomerase [Aliiroseovarius sp. PTFE2010]|uniref:peptidylprolyl isomerase n=1 Tax=Aliiroseovarius sp. PTFE2010 TaxID=3417190 RepID=UPI003CE80E95